MKRIRQPPPFPFLRRLRGLPLLAVPLACVSPTAAAASSPQAAGESVFVASSIGKLRVTTLASGLERPWSLAFLPDGRYLISERAGRLRAFDPATRTLSAPIGGLPEVWVHSQGGLLDIVPDPAFASTGVLYFSYAERGPDGKGGTAVARARLEGQVLRDLQVIFRQSPKLSVGAHYGSRLVFDGDGHLFVTLGENNRRPTAQHLGHHQGKVVRIFPDGRVPDDNPYRGTAGALPELWSIGIRNPQGAALNPWTGALWTVEHGPMGGDEINIPQAGRNYGWPIITYGLDYDGNPIPESVGSSAPGMEQPVHYWVPSIAPSGMAFYEGVAFRGWHGDVFVGGLVAKQLVRVDLDGDRVLGEERLLGELGWRIRDVRMGVDDALYVLTDETDGRLLRITPAKLPPPRRPLQPSAKPPYPERNTPPATREPATTREN